MEVNAKYSPYLVLNDLTDFLKATYPIQAYLFAKCVNVFTLYRDELIRRGNFWALMFFVQAGAVGFAYLVLGWSATLISTAVASYYRSEYFEDIVSKRISFFDEEGNSPGTLTARLSTDSSQLQQLLGSEMGMSLIAILSIVGSIIISFVFGWKLALVGVLTIMPVTLTMGYFRVHLESSFERLNALVFAESSQVRSISQHRNGTTDKIIVWIRSHRSLQDRHSLNHGRYYHQQIRQATANTCEKRLEQSEILYYCLRVFG